jgi:hypothetical protein
MIRPRSVNTAVLAAGVVAAITLSSCQLPSPSAKSASSKPKTSTVLVPFGNNNSDAPDTVDPLQAGSIPDTAGPSTSADVVEAGATVTEPAITIPPETDPSQNPICIAAKRVVTLNDRFDSTLSKALGGVSSVRALVRAMQSLPVEDLRNSYDDLSAELTIARRRRLATVRDFVVITGSKLASVKSVDDLSNVIGDLEADPRANRAAANSKVLSKYIAAKCGFALTLIGDHASKGG